MTQAARAATSGEKILLRTPGDWTRSHLAIYKPNEIYRATLNGVPASNDMVGEITFTHVSGTLGNVKAEMTIWVGSTATAKDLGTCRIRKAPVGSTIYIGYTSEIDWAGAATVYLTIMDHALLRAKPVLNDGGTIKMDGEFAYSDQHTVFDPVPVLSCHGVGTLVDGTVDLEWDASNSWIFDATLPSYLWSAPGSASIDDNTSATPVITYETAGNHPVYCTVTKNGKSATGVQFAFIFDENNKPYEVDVQAPSARYNGGGWSFNVRMYADADPTDIIEGALCVLFAEDWYGATKQSIGQLVNRENIICWGWIAGESIEWDAEVPAVEFAVQGPHYWLGKISANVTQLEFAATTPDSWGVMPGLTVDRALWHILHWRSNATALLNITLTGDTRYAPIIESAGTLWAQMSDIARSKIFGVLGCDRYGRLFAVIEPQLVPEVDRDWDSVMTLTKKDWKEKVDIARLPQRSLAMLFLSGWAVNSSGSTITLYSLAMGHIEAQTGDNDLIDSVLAESQSQLNEMAGLYMGWKNNEFEFEFSLSQNNRMVDLWPNQFLDVVLAAGDTPRGIAYTGNLIPRSITLQPDPETGCWSTEISCEAETFAELAVNGDLPDGEKLPEIIDDDDYDISTPPLPPLPPGDIPPTGEYTSRVLAHDITKGMIYTSNFDEVDPDAIVYKQSNWGMIEADFIGISDFILLPSGEVYILTGVDIGGVWTAKKQIWYAPSPTSSYTLALSQAQLHAMFPGTTTAWDIDSMAINKASGQIGLFVRSNVASDYRIVTGTHAGWTSGDVGIGGQGITSLRYGGGYWSGSHYPVVPSDSTIVVMSSNGTITRQTAITESSASSRASVVDIGSGSSAFAHDNLGTTDKFLCKSTDNFATYSLISSNFPGRVLATDVTGQYLMAVNNTTGAIYKSSDGGASWSAALSLPSIITPAQRKKSFCVDANRWIVVGDAFSATWAPITYTPDHGVTWEDRLGNLPALFPATVLHWDLVSALP